MNGFLNNNFKENSLGLWYNQTIHIFENLLRGESTVVPGFTKTENSRAPGLEYVTIWTVE